MAPQPAHSPRAPVTSCTKISWSTPPAALPSSLKAASLVSTSSSSWAESFGLDARWLVAELHERLRDRLDEGRRTADKHQRSLRCRPGNLREHRGIDAPSPPRPIRRLCARQRVNDL